MSVLIIIIAVVSVIYLFGGNKNAPTTINDNYGQYDEGSAMYDKVAYGDVNGLCK